MSRVPTPRRLIGIVFAASVALGLPGGAYAHDDHAAAGRKLTSAERTHFAEHSAIDRALTRFRRLPASKRRAIRRGILADGSRAQRAAVDDPADEVGRWSSAPFQAPDYAIHALMLRGGRVLLFSMGSGHGASNGGQGLRNDGQATIWDPALGEGPGAFTEVDPPPIPLDDPKKRPDSALLRPAPIFCAGQVQLADGRVLIAGGNLDQDGYGLQLVYLFDPATESWIREPNMVRYRWYPTLTRLADGRVAIVGGLDETHGDANSVELYPAPGTPVAGVDAGAPTSGLKTSQVGFRWSGVYPIGYLMPSGRLSSSYGGGGKIALFEPSTRRWVERTSSNVVYGSYPSSFLRPSGPDGPHEILQVGGSRVDAQGNDIVTAAGFAVDPERETVWRTAPALNVPRRNATAVLLPDGSAVIVNGGSSALRFPSSNGAPPANVEQRKIELWDPKTGKWTVGPASVVPRGYHSVALLLPDGRVMAGGDDWVSSLLDTNKADRMDSTIELYSPPYLFRGPRPVITGAPDAAAYGEQVAVTATSDRPVVRATLVAPAAVTHAVDMNQRLLELPVSVGPTGDLTVRMPTTSGAAPPGDYMLFLVDDDGVPSVARWIRVRPGIPGQGAPILTPLPGEEPEPEPEPQPQPTTPEPTTPQGPGPPVEQAPPSPQPEARTILPQATTPAKEPISAATLQGRTISVAAWFAPPRGKCPARVLVRVTVRQKTVDRRLQARAATVASVGPRCVVRGVVTLSRRPPGSARVQVSVRPAGSPRIALVARRG